MNIHNPAVRPGPLVLDTADYFRVSRRVFVEDDILALEREKIFHKCWLYVCHESEVEKPGDFLTRTIAGHNLILVRDKEKVNAFYNICPHRGATVCREDGGNTKLFRCLYHSWAFDTSGKTVARPEPERYGEGALESGLHDLKPVPRFANYRGFHFVNFDPEAGSLKDYLAGAAEYLDRIADKSEIGMEVIGGTHRYGINVNWKCVAENGVDGYHIVPVHQTYFDYMAAAGDQTPAPPPSDVLNPQRALGNGHVVMESRFGWGRPVARTAPSWGDAGAKEVAEIVARLEKRFGKEHADKICNNDFNMLIFPNFAVNDHMSTNIRILDPDGPGKVRINSWSLGPKEESRIMRKHRAKNFLAFLGPGGMATPDDCEALEHCQRGYNNLPDGWNDISRGLKSENKLTSDEDNFRTYWREWNRRLVES